MAEEKAGEPPSTENEAIQKAAKDIIRRLNGLKNNLDSLAKELYEQGRDEAAAAAQRLNSDRYSLHADALELGACHIPAALQTQTRGGDR